MNVNIEIETDDVYDSNGNLVYRRLKPLNSCEDEVGTFIWVMDEKVYFEVKPRYKSDYDKFLEKLTPEENEKYNPFGNREETTIYSVVCETWSDDGNELLDSGIVSSFLSEEKAVNFKLECIDKTTVIKNKQFIIESSFLS